MKEFMALMMAVLTVFSVAACKKEGVIGERKPAEEYVINCEAEKGIYVDNLIYDDVVTINGVYNEIVSDIYFTNCRFNKDVVFNGMIGCRVYMLEGCEFAEGAKFILKSDTNDAVMDTMHPRVITYVPMEYESDTMGGVVYKNVPEGIVNGEKFTAADCEHGYNSTEGLIDFDPEADYNVFAMMRWWEDGEEQILTYAMTE